MTYSTWAEAEAALAAVNGAVTMPGSAHPMAVKFADAKPGELAKFEARGAKRSGAASGTDPGTPSAAGSGSGGGGGGGGGGPGSSVSGGGGGGGGGGPSGSGPSSSGPSGSGPGGGGKRVRARARARAFLPRAPDPAPPSLCAIHNPHAQPRPRCRGCRAAAP